MADPIDELQIIELDNVEHIEDDFFVPGQKTKDIAAKRYNLKTLVDFANKLSDLILGETAITSNNTPSLVSVGLDYFLNYTPNVITYRKLGVPYSITVTDNTLQTDAPPETGARFDLVYIKTDVTPHQILVRKGEVSDNPEEPSLLEDEIKKNAIYISSSEVIVSNPVQNIIYLGQHGNDDNDGATVDTAVKTLDKARLLMVQKNYYTIICLDNNSYSCSGLTGYASFIKPTFFMPNANLVFSSPVQIPSRYSIDCSQIDGDLTTSNNTNIYINARKYIRSLTISYYTDLYLKGNCLIASLSIDATSVFYCDNIRVTSLTIAAGAKIYGTINGIVYNKEAHLGNYFPSTALLSLQNLLTTQVGLKIKAITSQTGDYLEFLDINDIPLFRVSVTGYLYAKRIYNTSGISNSRFGYSYFSNSESTTSNGDLRVLKSTLTNGGRIDAIEHCAASTTTQYVGTWKKMRALYYCPALADANDLESYLAYIELQALSSGICTVVFGDGLGFAQFMFTTATVITIINSSSNVFTTLQAGVDHVLIKGNGTNVRIINNLGSAQHFTAEVLTSVQNQ